MAVCVCGGGHLDIVVCLYGSVFSGVGDTGLSDEHQVLFQAVASWLLAQK